MRFLLAILLLLSALPAHAQNLQRALVVSSCGGQTLTAGPSTQLTMNPAGQLCLAGIGGGVSAPANSVAPVVSGTLTVGSLLSSTTGTWSNSPTSYAYQWLRGGVNIAGATSSTYTTVTADGGTLVGTQVTATNTGGSASALSNTLAIAVPYVGPGDVVSGATFYTGVRAYNAAYAAVGGKAFNLRRASDNTACDFDVALNGDLGLSDAGCSLGGGLTRAAFATQDATATCTISNVTGTCSGASSTPHVGSTVTGSGLTQPCFVTAVGTFTAGAGTVTLAGGNNYTSSPCGTLGSGTALTFTYGLFAATGYDQSGANLCTAAPCNATQATAAKQPQLLPTCSPGGKPCLGGVNASATALTTPTVATLLNGTATGIFSVVAERTALPTTFMRLAANGSATFLVAFNTTANTVQMTQGTIVTTTVSDNVMHAVQFVFSGATTSFINVDGVLTSSLTTGAALWSSNPLWVMSDGAARSLSGYMEELGVWPFAGSTTQATSLCHSQFSYYGTATSC